MAYFVKDTQLKGTYDSGGTTINVVRYEFEVDTESDLPTQTQFLSTKNIKICMTSKAHVIANNKTFEMKSDGTWVDMTNAPSTYDASDIIYDNTTSGMTATNVQDAIDEIHDLDEMQDRALAELYAENTNQQQEINYAINTGVKNLFDIHSEGAIYYRSSATFSGDSVTITGTAGFSRFVIPITLKAGAYIFTANVSSISTAGRVRFNTASDGSGETIAAAIDFTQAGAISREFSLAQDTDFFVMLYSSVASADTSSSLTIEQIMIRPAEISDNHYQPYAKTNSELTVLTDEDRAALVELVDDGSKNKLKLGFTTKTVGTQTAAMTADGTGITVNGDRNTSSDVILVYDLSTNESTMSDTRYTIPEGKYVIAPTGTSQLRIQVYCHDGSGVNSERLGQASTESVVFEYTAALKTQYPYIAYRLWASRSSSFNNLTIYPMVCTLSEWKISQTFQPYRPSWQEMYDMIKALQ